MEHLLAHEKEVEEVAAQMDRADPATRSYIESLASTADLPPMRRRSTVDPGSGGVAQQLLLQPGGSGQSHGHHVSKRSHSRNRRRMVSTAEVEDLGVTSVSFDALALDLTQLIAAALQIFQTNDFPNTLRVPVSTLASFLTLLSEKYSAKNYYHNFRHAVDICHVCYRMLVVTNLDRSIPRLELTALLVAAVGHDVGHLGVNNAFLINTAHELAIRYNDISPLENMHCALLFEVMSSEGCNIFANLEEADRKDARRVVINTILCTDMAKHGGMLVKLKVRS